MGATRGAAHAFIEWMLEGDALLWGDTTQANLKRYVERYFIPALRKQKIAYEWSSTDKVLKVGEGYTDFRSAERPENWEGFGYRKVFLNEAGIILSNRSLYENTVLPMMVDFKDSQLIAAGVPKGNNAFYELFNRALNKEVGFYTPASHIPPKPGQIHFAYTWQDNPWLDAEAAQRIFSSLTERNRLEAELGQFLSDGGGVFRNVETSHTTQTQEPKAQTVYVAGVDWGKHNDFTVISVWDANTQTEVYLDRFNQIDYSFQVQRLQAVIDKYKPVVIIAESNSMGEPLIEQLQRRGFPVRPFQTTNATKAEAVEALSLAMEQSMVHLINDPIAKSEMLAFEIVRTQTGLSRYSAPEGMHDDTVIARCLAYQAVNNKPLSPETTRKLEAIL